MANVLSDEEREKLIDGNPFEEWLELDKSDKKRREAKKLEEELCSEKLEKLQKYFLEKIYNPEVDVIRSAPFFFIYNSPLYTYVYLGASSIKVESYPAKYEGDEKRMLNELSTLKFFNKGLYERITGKYYFKENVWFETNKQNVDELIQWIVDTYEDYSTRRD